MNSLHLGAQAPMMGGTLTTGIYYADDVLNDPLRIETILATLSRAFFNSYTQTIKTPIS